MKESHILNIFVSNRILGAIAIRFKSGCRQEKAAHADRLLVKVEDDVTLRTIGWP
jgi:hypothetical protein